MNAANIFLAPFFLIAIMVLVGAYIRAKIWGEKNRPTNAFEYGRCWAAYMAFFMPISTVNRLKYGAAQWLVSTIVLTICVCLIAFVGGFLYGSYKTKRFSKSSNLVNTGSSESDALYEQALNEINQGSQNAAIWARSLAQGDGNIEKAKAAYIQMRVASLTAMNKPALVPSANQNSTFLERWRANDNMALHLVLIVIVLGGVFNWATLGLKSESPAASYIAPSTPPQKDFWGDLARRQEDASKALATTKEAAPATVVEKKAPPSTDPNLPKLLGTWEMVNWDGKGGYVYRFDRNGVASLYGNRRPVLCGKFSYSLNNGVLQTILPKNSSCPSFKNDSDGKYQVEIDGDQMTMTYLQNGFVSHWNRLN